ncbi:MAG: hypothetical protein JKX90_07185 [Colwellia sp.]|nr:hypothetical protein [Colwellia sp.]
MKSKIVIMLLLFVCLSHSTSAFANGHGNGAGSILVLNLVGTAEMILRDVPGFVDAMCFDVDLLNAKTGKKIGMARDCLSDVVNGENGGLALVGTTYFYMNEGMLVTRGNTTVQPVNPQTVTPYGQPITHITGASGDSNAVIEGTGRFARSSATVRLSGMVDMTTFGGIEGDIITFDCLFVITLIDD